MFAFLWPLERRVTSVSLQVEHIQTPLVRLWMEIRSTLWQVGGIDITTSRNATSHGSLRVVELGAKAHLRTEAFITAHPEELIHHHSAWLEVLEKEYGQGGIYFGCENSQGHVVTLLDPWGSPFTGQNTGRRLSSMPRSLVAGFIAPLDWVDKIAAFAARTIPQEKLILGFGVCGSDWVDGRGSEIDWKMVLEVANTYDAEVRWASGSYSPWFAYADLGEKEHVVWSVQHNAKVRDCEEIQRGRSSLLAFRWREAKDFASIELELVTLHPQACLGLKHLENGNDIKL